MFCCKSSSRQKKLWKLNKLVKLHAISLQITESELISHIFLSRESFMRITNNHTNRFENFFVGIKNRDFASTNN